MASNLTYKEAGVDINAGDELVQRIKAPVKKTRRPEVIGGLGGFGALTRIPKGYTNPVLVTGTDGVGTKLRLAIDLGKHGTVGQDLVAMSVNDIVVQGAEPFLFLDYYGTGKLDVVANVEFRNVLLDLLLFDCTDNIHRYHSCPDKFHTCRSAHVPRA